MYAIIYSDFCMIFRSLISYLIITRHMKCSVFLNGGINQILPSHLTLFHRMQGYIVVKLREVHLSTG